MKYGIIDTGTSLMYLPKTDYNLFRSTIEAQNLGLTCTNEYCYSDTKPCSTFVDQLHPLEIHIGQVMMTIPPSGYLLDNVLAMCLLAVGTSGSDTQPFIFGDTFIRNYYTTFDYKKKIVSFAVSSNAPEGVKVERDFTGWVIFGIILSVIAGVIILGAILIKIIQCKKKTGVTIGGTGDYDNYRYRDKLEPLTDSIQEGEP
jgi:hypothetical protein